MTLEEAQAMLASLDEQGGGVHRITKWEKTTATSAENTAFLAGLGAPSSFPVVYRPADEHQPPYSSDPVLQAQYERGRAKRLAMETYAERQRVEAIHALAVTGGSPAIAG
jgi:hypothetical protein